MLAVITTNVFFAETIPLAVMGGKRERNTQPAPEGMSRWDGFHISCFIACWCICKQDGNETRFLLWLEYTCHMKQSRLGLSLLHTQYWQQQRPWWFAGWWSTFKRVVDTRNCFFSLSRVDFFLESGDTWPCFHLLTEVLLPSTLAISSDNGTLPLDSVCMVIKIPKSCGDSLFAFFPHD